MKLTSNLKFKKFEYSYYPELNEKPYEEYHREAREKDKIKVGMILKMKDGRMLLVGDVNLQLGSCDHCRDFSYSDILEYASIYD